LWLVAAQPHCDCTTSLRLHNLIATAQPHCGCTASLWLHSLIATAQPHCDCTASLWLHNLIVTVQPYFFTLGTTAVSPQSPSGAFDAKKTSVIHGTWRYRALC